MKKALSTMLGLTLILSLLVVTGCNSKEKAVETSEAAGKATVSKPIIAVTIVPEQTFVEAVCGDLAEVVTLVPPGNSPENYEPTPQEREKFSKASLYFSIGVPTEEANILPNVGDIKVVSLQKVVASVYPERMFASGERDPHIWLSPKRAKVMVETIAREMGELDAANKETYAKNAAAYIAQLDELDKEISSALKGVQSKKFIVYHPAFGYLADDYELTMYALEQEGKEATPRHLQEMIELAKKENIKAIFYQEEIDSSQSEAFAEEIGGKTIQLAPLAADYIGNLKKMAETMAEVMQ
ncbi:MAG: zinc ABC transporter substrate-binding protein [Candidatus Dehalobacter alkaniphilus]|uniref:metal ABC transporter solute-binding protein, Zn/Mn family n=1 Tax=Dehalobacter sp. DCM TaxID=2907827 RepID=UPI0030818DC9|nr:zinc ABC transporter substrate-binding protein [Dehalobacter sp. DCM]